MNVTHAPYAVLGDLTILYGKTTKTACGKRVKTDRLRRRGTQTCMECQQKIDQDRKVFAEMKEQLELMQKISRDKDNG